VLTSFIGKKILKFGVDTNLMGQELLKFSKLIPASIIELVRECCGEGKNLKIMWKTSHSSYEDPAERIELKVVIKKLRVITSKLSNKRTLTHHLKARRQRASSQHLEASAFIKDKEGVPI